MKHDGIVKAVDTFGPGRVFLEFRPAPPDSFSFFGTFYLKNKPLSWFFLAFSHSCLKTRSLGGPIFKDSKMEPPGGAKRASVERGYLWLLRGPYFKESNH